MKIRPCILASASAIAVLGTASVASAQQFSYHPRFVSGVNELERSAKGFHSDYVSYLKGARRWPAECNYKALLSEACATAELSARIAEQIRCGHTPCKIEANARKLDACITKVNGLMPKVRLSYCLQNDWALTRGRYANFDRGFDRALYVHNQRGSSSSRSGYANNNSSRGGYSSYNSRGYTPRATRPSESNRYQINSYDDLIRFISARMRNRY